MTDKLHPTGATPQSQSPRLDALIDKKPGVWREWKDADFHELSVLAKKIERERNELEREAIRYREEEAERDQRYEASLRSESGQAEQLPTLNPACRASFNTRDGWNCDCEHKHPLVCSKAASADKTEGPTLEALAQRLADGSHTRADIMVAAKVIGNAAISSATAEPSVTSKEWMALVDAAREEGRLAGRNEVLRDRLNALDSSGAKDG